MSAPLAVLTQVDALLARQVRLAPSDASDGDENLEVATLTGTAQHGAVFAVPAGALQLVTQKQHVTLDALQVSCLGAGSGHGSIQVLHTLQDRFRVTKDIELLNDLRTQGTAYFHEQVQAKGLVVATSGRFGGDIVCTSGGVYARTINLSVAGSSGAFGGQTVGYGFCINSNDGRLEIVQCLKDEASGRQAMHKVATFGGVRTFGGSNTSLYDALPDVGSSGGNLAALMVNDPNNRTWTRNAFGDTCIAGNVGIRTGTSSTAPLAYSLVVGGDIAASNMYCASVRQLCDARTKSHRSNLAAEECMAVVLNLQPCTYQQCGELKSGFMAQEVGEVVPHAVREAAMHGYDDCKVLDSFALLPYLTASIQHLHAEVARLQTAVQSAHDTVTARDV